MLVRRVQQFVQCSQFLVASYEERRRINGCGPEPRKHIVGKPGNQLQVRHRLRHGSIAVPGKADQGTMEEVGQLPVEPVLIRAGKRHMLKVEDRAGITVKGGRRMPPQLIEQHRAKAVYI